MAGQWVLAIDQGTTSSRAIVFDRAGRVVASAQEEHRQVMPRPGWVEHDPLEIWGNVREVAERALASAEASAVDGAEPEACPIAAVGVANQRETAVVWDKTTGRPVHNAIVWQDTRTLGIVTELAGGDLSAGGDRYRDRTGLPLSTYFAGPKVKWILDNVPGARADAEAGKLLFGTIDTWLIWNLTGGVDGGVHVTDVTNASRTLMMDLRALAWDDAIVADLGIPPSMLPAIASSSQVYGLTRVDGLPTGVPVAGDLGDQQAAAFGQAAFTPGAAKNTYGTG
ncbi:MAG: glycerol kinase, partial [Propionibacteriaceae bacterium]|nr:glycerol kinase [Propionibacteriaceae bacterium]